MVKKKNYNARPSYITAWNQQVIYIFIPWKFLISLKFHEKKYERTWYVWEKTNHSIRDQQAEMCSQLWNTWRSGKAHETSSGRRPPASVTTSPAVSSFRHKTVMKQTLSVEWRGLWLRQTLPALWMRDLPFKCKQREEMQNGAKHGQHGLALDAWGSGCHTGLQGKLAGREARLRSHGGHLIEPWGNILFCSLPPSTGLQDSVLKRLSPPLKGLSKSQKKKKCYNTLRHAHSSPSQLSVERVPTASPHRCLIISETFAAIAWVYFFPFPGSTTVLLCRKVTDGMQMWPFAFLYCHHSDSDLEGGSVAFFENTQM